MDNNAPGRVYFNTDALPERDRFPCTARKSAADMSGSISERKINLDFVLSSPCSAPALSTSFTAPTLRLTPSERRNWSAMAMNRCAWILLESGSARQTQCGNDHELASHTAILCDGGYAGACNFITDAQFWSLRIPRRKITDLLPRVTRFAGAKLDKNITAQRLLFSYLRVIFDIRLNAGRVNELTANTLSILSRSRSALRVKGVRSPRNTASAPRVVRPFCAKSSAAAVIPA
jgi:hypothetical protein